MGEFTLVGCGGEEVGDEKPGEGRGFAMAGAWYAGVAALAALGVLIVLTAFAGDAVRCTPPLAAEGGVTERRTGCDGDWNCCVCCVWYWGMGRGFSGCMLGTDDGGCGCGCVGDGDGASGDG